MMNIRQALPEDIEQICEIERDNAQNPWTKPLFEAELRNQFAHLLCAETDEGIVGICDMHIMYDKAHINEICVPEAYRNQGIATAMLQAAADIAQAKGCVKITLHVRSANRDAIRLYEANGYKKDGYQWGFYQKPADDALVLCKTF